MKDQIFNCVMFLIIALAVLLAGTSTALFVYVAIHKHEQQKKCMLECRKYPNAQHVLTERACLCIEGSAIVHVRIMR